MDVDFFHVDPARSESNDGMKELEFTPTVKSLMTKSFWFKYCIFSKANLSRIKNSPIHGGSLSYKKGLLVQSPRYC